MKLLSITLSSLLIGSVKLEKSSSLRFLQLPGDVMADTVAPVGPNDGGANNGITTDGNPSEVLASNNLGTGSS